MPKPRAKYIRIPAKLAGTQKPKVSNAEKRYIEKVAKEKVSINNGKNNNKR